MKQRKDGRWLKVKTINGKQVYFYSTEPTERKALKDIENQMLNYQDKEEKGLTFNAVAEKWEEMKYKTLEWNTYRRYNSMVKQLQEVFGNKYIKQITANNIESFFDGLVHRSYSTKSIKDQMSVTKMIFKYAKKQGYVTADATEYLTPPKGTPKITRQSLTDEEIETIKNNVHLEFGLLAYFMMYTGLRKGEALALTYADIDKNQNIININKSLEHFGNEPRLKTPKTKAGIRIVPLLDVVKKVIPNGNKTDYIFGENGKPMRHSYFNLGWKAYCEQTGLNITSHQLRHTFATLLYEWDIDVKDSQELLGHSDISTTRNIYTHIRQSRIASTTKKLNDKLNDVVNF